MNQSINQQRDGMNYAEIENELVNLIKQERRCCLPASMPSQAHWVNFFSSLSYLSHCYLSSPLASQNLLRLPPCHQSTWPLQSLSLSISLSLSLPLSSGLSRTSSFCRHLLQYPTRVLVNYLQYRFPALHPSFQNKRRDRYRYSPSRKEI